MLMTDSRRDSLDTSVSNMVGGGIDVSIGNLVDDGGGCVATSSSRNVDDGLTSLSWLQNLNMCMTRLGAPTPPTPPASPNATLSNIHNPANRSHSSHGQVRLTADGSLKSTYQTLTTSHSIQNGGGGCGSVIHGKAGVGGNMSSNSAASTVGGTGGGGGRSKKSTQQQQQQTEQEAIDYKTDGSAKPPFSYATLICMAMKANKNKMTLNSIYKWIRENFLYYQNADPSWQVSVSISVYVCLEQLLAMTRNQWFQTITIGF